MDTAYFKMIGQKTCGKLVLIAVVDAESLGKVPDIFEVQCIKLPSTVYTGTYPTLKINTETIKDITEEKKGLGVDGLITASQWYYKEKKTKDVFGIGLAK